MKTLGRFLIKLLFRFSRRWGKTARGKWHLVQMRFYTVNCFMPCCAPWTSYVGVEYSSKQPPSSNICKHCQTLIDGGIY